MLHLGGFDEALGLKRSLQGTHALRCLAVPLLGRARALILALELLHRLDDAVLHIDYSTPRKGEEETQAGDVLWYDARG